MQRRPSLSLVLAAGALVMSAALGTRQTFGLFLQPIGAAHVVPISLLAFALAVQNLVWGIAQPVAGALSDRYGPGADRRGRRAAVRGRSGGGRAASGHAERDRSASAFSSGSDRAG